MQLVSENRPQVKRDHFLRLNEVETATGLKKTTLYVLMKRGEFVPSVKVTPRCTRWPASAVYQWVQDRIAASKGAAA